MIDPSLQVNGLRQDSSPLSRISPNNSPRGNNYPNFYLFLGERTLNDVSRRSDAFKNAGKRQLGALTHNVSRVSIEDMVKSSKKCDDNFGIEGIPIFHRFVLIRLWVHQLLIYRL